MISCATVYGDATAAGGKRLKDRLTGWAQDAADIAMAMTPRRTPDAETARRCRIVAHRGAHDYNRAAQENTLEAFELARAAGVWGVETDIRWTADLTPVICHDPDTARVFGKDARLCDVSFEELRAAVPAVPSLAVLPWPSQTVPTVSVRSNTFSTRVSSGIRPPSPLCDKR